MLVNLLLLLFIYTSLTGFFRETSFTVRLGIFINVAFTYVMYKYTLDIEIDNYTIMSIIIGLVMAVLHKILNLDKYILRNHRK